MTITPIDEDTIWLLEQVQYAPTDKLDAFLEMAAFLVADGWDEKQAREFALGLFFGGEK